MDDNREFDFQGLLKSNQQVHEDEVPDEGEPPAEVEPPVKKGLTQSSDNLVFVEKDIGVWQVITSREGSNMSSVIFKFEDEESAKKAAQGVATAIGGKYVEKDLSRGSTLSRTGIPARDLRSPERKDIDRARQGKKGPEGELERAKARLAGPL